MGNQIKLLTFLELKNLFGINVFRHTKDPKAKRKYLLMLGLWLFVGIVFCGYIGGLVYGLVYLGMSSIVPAYLMVIASLLIFAFGIFKAGPILFSQKGYDQLCSLPVTQQAIVASRFLQMYGQDLLFSIGILLPGTVIYGILVNPGIGFYILTLLAVFLVPVLPLAASALVGAGIVAISSRMKRKNLAQTVLTLGFALVMLAGSFSISSSAEDMSVEMLASLAATVGTVIGKVYPPAVWMGDSIVTGNLGGMALSLGVCLAAFAAVVLLIGGNYRRICQSLFATSARHDYRMEKLKGSSPLTALWKREAKRYFSSAIYVTNTILGPILGMVLCGFVGIVGLDTIAASFHLPIPLAEVLPFVVAAVFTMMTVTSVSISMEGKHFWIVKSLPIPTKTLLDSKILLNLSLILPFYTVGQILLTIGCKPGLSRLLWQLAIPAAVILFSVVFGVWVNLRLYRFDWDKEEVIVKQSAASMLGGFAGPLVSILFGVAALNVPAAYTGLAKGGLCMLLLIVTGLMYRDNNRCKLDTL